MNSSVASMTRIWVQSEVAHPTNRVPWSFGCAGRIGIETNSFGTIPGPKFPQFVGTWPDEFLTVKAWRGLAVTTVTSRGISGGAND